MNKPFGFRGTLAPQSAFKEVVDVLNFGNILVSIKNGIFEVGYDQEDEKERALIIANALIASWSKRNNIKIKVDFNQSWKVELDGSKFIGLDLHDGIKVTDHVITNTVTIRGKGHIIKHYADSYSFANDIGIVRKAEKDKTLELALGYFYREVVDDKRPMYGIHKAVEQIVKHLPGKNEDEKRNNLAAITGHSRLYIDDLMSSIQTQRHSEEWLRLEKVGKIIEDRECIERAKNLIDGYAGSLSV